MTPELNAKLEEMRLRLEAHTPELTSAGYSLRPARESINYVTEHFKLGAEWIRDAVKAAESADGNAPSRETKAALKSIIALERLMREGLKATAEARMNIDRAIAGIDTAIGYPPAR